MKRKIPQDQIKEIRKSKESHSKLALKYDVSAFHIQKIRLNVTNCSDDKRFRDALENYLRALPEDKKKLIVDGNNSEDLI